MSVKIKFGDRWFSLKGTLELVEDEMPVEPPIEPPVDPELAQPIVTDYVASDTRAEIGYK